MDAKLYKSITECDARAVWPMVRNTVVEQLMGPGCTPIPYLMDAQYYDHGSLIVKESRSPVERLKGTRPGIITIGRLTDFIDDARDTNLIGWPKTKKAPERMNPAFTFEETALKNKLLKTVTVEVDGCERYTMENIPGEDSLTVGLESRGFQYVKKIYLVYEVCYAERLVVIVSIGNETDRVEINQRVPVGFKMRKYQLKEDGALGKANDQPNKAKFVWIKRCHFRNPMDSLPDIPDE
ncbi:uncharacterized protein C11orf42-like [Mytilus californianus]|uniref:uncharacterized protein C11orf42-like n=1 Tax=Mytilus californianus TaxID=6549 RepID=UPI0022481AB2|nr:uncharacterized protein C11orf42-like [Mytilus californianus]